MSHMACPKEVFSLRDVFELCIHSKKDINPTNIQIIPDFYYTTMNMFTSQQCRL